MERLTRGMVAVQSTGGVYVGWRMFGYEYDVATPARVSYNVYRNGARVASVTDSTNYLDAAGTATATYFVRAVIGGAEQGASETASVWAQNYLRIPLSVAALPAKFRPGVHDAQYRSAVSWQNGAYNQPPSTAFDIGGGMAAPPVPNITVR
jgi:hypothetical protein